MAKAVINKERCKGCFLCMAFCPKALIRPGSRLNKKGFAFVEFHDDGQCRGCKICATVCPECCIEIYK